MPYRRTLSTGEYRTTSTDDVRTISLAFSLNQTLDEFTISSKLALSLILSGLFDDITILSTVGAFPTALSKRFTVYKQEAVFVGGPLRQEFVGQLQKIVFIGVWK